MKEVEELIPSIREGIDRLQLPQGFLLRSFPSGRLLETLRNLERRLGEGSSAPLRVAFFGPTGVGKSKVFNSLAGGTPSPSGYRRPFTMQSVYLLHQSRNGLAGSLPGDVKIHAGESWRSLVLTDTPDFDSVETRNRAEADRVFREAEAFIFLTDVQKYADHSTWEYLERIFQERKPAIIVLNKVSGDGPVSDFGSRLETRFGDAARRSSRIVLAEHPIGDDEPIPASDQGLARLREALEDLEGTPESRSRLLDERFRSDLDGFFEEWTVAETALESYAAGLEELAERLAARVRSAAEDLRVELRTGIDPGLKAEVYSRVVEKLQKLDLLRYPRKLLALPLEGIKTIVRMWFPRSEARNGGSELDPARSETFQLLEARLFRVYEETREDGRRQARSPEALTDDDLHALRIGHDELSELYRTREASFATWLAKEARETASTLTGENKIKFILSQVIYNSVIVGVQIHTAGAFTLAELLTDSVLSPMVAKAVGIAVSSQKVAEFEKMAQAEHHRLLVEILEEFRGRVARHLAERGAWKEDFERLRAAIQGLRERRDDLIAAFRGRTGPDGS